MRPIVELAECLQDSPKFRIAVEETAEDIDQLEGKLDKLVKSCNTMVEAGKSFVTARGQFINSVWDLVPLFRDDSVVMNSLNKIVQSLMEMQKFNTILSDQAQRSVCKNLNNFMRNDLKKVKDNRKQFEKISDDLDQALYRSSQVQKSKMHECEDADNNLASIRSTFRHVSLDYVYEASMLQAKKRYEILQTLLSFLKAHTTFFHQGYELCQDDKPALSDMDSSIQKIRDETDELKSTMADRHSLVGRKENISPGNRDVQVEGYLYKRTTNAFKTWNRRWFSIQNNQLVYRKRSKDDSLTVMEEDLRLCTVKHVDADRRFCFEVLSPSRTHMLQADSEDTYTAWITALQVGINAAHHHREEKSKSKGSDSDLVGGKSSYSDLTQALETDATATPLEEIKNIAGNDRCCDCGSDQPSWASINLGITLCIECSGIHRSLGVHHSKVKSLSLDTWEPELIGVMKELGNSFVNTIYEANVDETIAARATPSCPRTARESWIRAKYVVKAFTAKSLNDGQKVVRRGMGVRRKLQGPEPRLSSAGSTISGVSSSSALSSEAGTASAGGSLEGLDMGEVQHQIRKEKILSPKIRRTAVFFEDTPSDPVDEDDVKTLRNLSCKEVSPDYIPERESVVRSRSFRLKEVKKLRRPINGSEAPDSSSSSLSEECESEKISQGDNSKVELDDESGSPEEPSVLLYRASLVPDIKAMFAAIAIGGDMNWVNGDDCGKSAIHQAIHSGSIPACEFLFLNGAKTDAKDTEGRTPLHLATELGNTGQVCLLLKRGADRDAKDYRGQDALKLAIDFENADIVTLLRLARLNEAMKESDYGNSDDTTFSEVVRDFSQLASNNPEKLKRSK